MGEFPTELGEWHGSFASLDASGTIVDSTPSILLFPFTSASQ